MSETAEQIQKRMEVVRCDLIDDVDEVVRSAKEMVSWREYVQRYPWVCVGAAVALGYLVVPRRLELISPDAGTLLELAKRNKLVVKPSPKPEKRRGLVSNLVTLATHAVVRGAAAYFSQQAGKAFGAEASESDRS